MTSIGAGAKQWAEKVNRSKHPLWIVTVASFLETIIIPIPIEVVLIPMMASNRGRIWLIATLAFVGCMAGALLGYGVGKLLYGSVGIWFIEVMGYEEAWQSFRSFFEHQGFIAILVVGLVPVPFQLAMIAAGLAGYPLALFVLAAMLARSVRYYGLAFLVQRYGKEAHRLWQRHSLATALGAAAIVMVLWFVGQHLADRIV